MSLWVYFYYFYKQSHVYMALFPCFFCVLLLRALSGSWLRPGLNLNSFSSFCASVSYQGALPTGAIFKQNSPLRVFRRHNINSGCRSTWGLVVAKSCLTLPPNTKVTQAIFLAIPSEWRVTHPHTGGVVSGPQVYARSSQIPCLVAPAFSFDSLTPAAVKKSAYGHQDSCPWRGNCFGCFLASQGPLPTLILGLCSSPWVPAIIHCMELLHMKEGGKIGRKHP